MAVQEIDVRKKIAASPRAIYRLLEDSSTWPDWTPVESFEPVELGDRDGVGEIRLFRTGRVGVREQIVEKVPDRRLVYILRAGLAVKEYRAEIDVEPVEGGSQVRWHTTFKPKFPGTGGIYRRGLTKMTERFVEGLAEAAENSSPDPG